MNTKEEITQHSQKKLEVYEKYLKAYLSVMLNTRFNPIVIVDLFAGKGRDDKGHDGSAVKAAKLLKTLDHLGKVRLLLNDSSKEYCENLRHCLNTKDKRIKITNLDANIMIKKVLQASTPLMHRLFFIDPFGYSEIQLETYRQLFSVAHADILVFVPTYHVYRFLHADRKKSAAIIRFLNAFGVDENHIRSTYCYDDLITNILNGLKNVTRVPYIYKKEIKHETCNSRYCLFFITKHIYGADKFLESLDNLTSEEPDLFKNTVDDQDNTLIQAILAREQWNNKEIYEEGIKLGFSTASIRRVLELLETEGKIVVRAIRQRRNGGFYINYNYWKEKSLRIEILPQPTHK